MATQHAHYATFAANANCGLCAWSFSAPTPLLTRVAPDGCSDFIIDTSAEQQSRWFISALSDSAYTVPTPSAAAMSGIRLRPGTQIDIASLADYLRTHDPVELLHSDQLDEFCHLRSDLSTILARLEMNQGNLNMAATDIGITLRTLQRVVARGTGRTPHFWFALARIRKAIKAVPDFERLADVATAFAFSDQSHFTRESKRWFGVSPGKVASDPELYSQLHEQGYGTA